jgi:translation elongation factor EF-G
VALVVEPLDDEGDGDGEEGVGGAAGGGGGALGGDSSDPLANVFTQALASGVVLRAVHLEASPPTGAGGSGAGGGAAGSEGDGEEGGEGDGAANGELDARFKPLPPQLADALRDAIGSGLGRGPLLGYPLVRARVTLDERRCAISPDTTAAALKAATARALAAALADCGVELLEPVMRVEVSVPDGPWVGEVLSDLTSQRRARVRELGRAGGGSGGGGAGGGVGDGGTSGAPVGNGTSGATSGGSGGGTGRVLVHATVPLVAMVGYSTGLRSRTAGEGAFSMAFEAYAPVGGQVLRALREEGGLR